MHTLMVKTHNVTGLKYLCYTQAEGAAFDRYTGSGLHWKRHLRQHGVDISTEVIFQTEDYAVFKEAAIKTSAELNIVNSTDWANIRPEEGTGGDTVSMKQWITNGVDSKYINKGEAIPEGWRKGRSGTVFNDPARQAEFSKKADRSKTSMTLKKTWAEGSFKRDNDYLVKRMTENNPTKNPETKEKLKQAALNDSDNRSKRLKERWDSGLMPKTKGGENHPSKRPEVKEKLRQAAIRQHHGKDNSRIS